MYVTLIKSLRIIKLEFDVIFPYRQLSVLKQIMHHKDKKLFSEYLNYGKYSMHHILIHPGGGYENKNSQMKIVHKVLLGFLFILQTFYVDLLGINECIAVNLHLIWDTGGKGNNIVIF